MPYHLHRERQCAVVISCSCSDEMARGRSVPVDDMFDNDVSPAVIMYTEIARKKSRENKMSHRARKFSRNGAGSGPFGVHFEELFFTII